MCEFTQVAILSGFQGVVWAQGLGCQWVKYDSLKEEQIECIRRVICLREDVLAVLPTGFGKSLIYQIIPKVLECLKNESDDTQKFIVCVVSPLEYIRKQQVASINKLHGLSVAAVGDNEETDKDIEDGGANIVFGSAEQWLSDKWKKALQFGSLHDTEVLVVDEVHTVETWYGAFRPFFMQIKSYS